MSHKQQTIKECADALVSYGYKVYLAKNGQYGFYTDGKRVVSFHVDFFAINFSGQYKSKSCGTGWRIAADMGIPTKEDADRFMRTYPPQWATRGETVFLTTPEQYLSTYGESSGFCEFHSSNHHTSEGL